MSWMSAELSPSSTYAVSEPAQRISSTRRTSISPSAPNPEPAKEEKPDEGALDRCAADRQLDPLQLEHAAVVVLASDDDTGNVSYDFDPVDSSSVMWRSHTLK